MSKTARPAFAWQVDAEAAVVLGMAEVEVKDAGRPAAAERGGDGLRKWARCGGVGGGVVRRMS